MADGSLEFSYAEPSDPVLKRLAIRGIERLTGQPRLRRMYLDWCETGGAEPFFEGAIRRLRLRIEHDPAKLAAIPAQGPLVVVANHPFGVLDGLIMGWLMSQRRERFKILVNSVLYRAPEAREWLLPIDFAETREALATNLRSRDAALAVIRAGGAVAIFPGGTVSTAEKPFLPAVDPRWKPFTARIIQAGRATVVPVFFEGQNSRLFHFASQISVTLRVSLIFKEVADKIGETCRVRIGDPIAYPALAGFRDRQMLADHLRELTYALGPDHARGRLMEPLLQAA